MNTFILDSVLLCSSMRLTDSFELVIVSWIIPYRTCCFEDTRVLTIPNSAESPIDPRWQIVKAATSKLARFPVQVGSRNSQFCTTSLKTADHCTDHT